MTDLSTTIAPKSDQLNSDDLIAGPRTIRITKVSACPDSAEQPIAIFFEGDGGKPYKPCKSMRRVLVGVWGKDGNAYPGRSMTLYRDEKVTFGGLAVGGIRISHMSDIEGNVTMALTTTRANRKPFTVMPLRTQERPRTATKATEQQAPREDAGDGLTPDGDAPNTDDVPVLDWAGAFTRALSSYDNVDELRDDWNRRKAELRSRSPDAFTQLNNLVVDRASAIKAAAVVEEPTE